MHLEILPTRSGGAAENMATDFLLLQRYPRVTPRFRHYGWHRPAFTFGYSQKFSFIQSQLPAGGRFDTCRRPTGGGLVDHRDDWTYALVIPRGHPLEERPATQSYREIHEALAAALRAQGVPAVTKQKEVEHVDPNTLSAEPAPWGQGAPPAAGPAGVCFQRAEIYDVIHERTSEKIAGAAQKRNKHGLLFQGSIWRPAAGAGTTVDWDRFNDDFVAQLSSALAGPAQPTPWPDLAEEELSALVEHYSTPEWNAFR
ncbi:MAG: lipoate--protein ligase family protein [Verrucomicrobia bacterium]|nr:lipoate--protein ligase family protein [Verrucomicrobiota bacterium]